jgi:hypothetical protein
VSEVSPVTANLTVTFVAPVIAFGTAAVIVVPFVKVGSVP